MQPRTVRMTMTIEQARALSINLQAMVRAFEGEALMHAKRGLIDRSLKFELKAQECREQLELVEEAIAHRPLPLYVFDEIEVVQ